METINIAVYRDTFEEFWDNPSMGNSNIAEIIVTMDFAEQYWKDTQTEYYETFEDFLNEFTCDDTEDFYEYASKRNEIIEILRW